MAVSGLPFLILFFDSFLIRALAPFPFKQKCFASVRLHLTDEDTATSFAAKGESGFALGAIVH